MVPYYYLSVKAQNIALLLGLNNVPLVADLEAEGVVTDLPVNAWIMPAGNKLTAYLTWPDDVPFEPGTATIEAQLFIADPEKDEPTPKQVIATLRWPLPDVPEAYPYSIEIPVEIQDPPDVSLWSEATRLEDVSASDKQAILALVDELRNALVSGNAEAALALMEYRYADEARAEGKEFKQVREAVLEQYEWLVSLGDLQSKPLKLDEAVFRVVGDDKLVFVSRGDEGEAVELEHEESERSFGIAVYVAKIKDKWTIVR